MKFEQVLVEREDITGNRVLASSGILIDDKFVILTSNIFAQEKEYPKLNDNEHLHLAPFGNSRIVLNVVLNQRKDICEVKQGTVLAIYRSKTIQKSEIFFKGFAIDSVDNNRNVGDILSTFFILTLEVELTLADFKQSLKKWWDLVGSFSIKQCDEVWIESSPFANRHFMNSWSQGIVSNLVGKNSCLIISDCPTTPGSEGSPVFIGDSKKSSKYPVGIVVSSVSFWRGEWTGLTIITDIRSFIIELIDCPVRISNANMEILNHLVIASCEFSLIRLYSESSWGTAILLDSNEGIFITNSHVIKTQEPILLFKTKKFRGTVLYQTNNANSYDLAVIQCKEILTENLKSILVSKRECNVGETVYSVGFSLFSEDCCPTPTISKGCISKKHRFMLKTTCFVHAGASGGAILDEYGCLLGIIVCNTKLSDGNVIFPKMNMAIPYTSIANIIARYVEENDIEILKELNATNKDMTSELRIEGKL